jgi:hypothetical protein
VRGYADPVMPGFRFKSEVPGATAGSHLSLHSVIGLLLAV